MLTMQLLHHVKSTTIKLQNFPQCKPFCGNNSTKSCINKADWYTRANTLLLLLLLKEYFLSAVQLKKTSRALYRS